MATLYAKTAGGNFNAAGTWSNVSASGGDSSGPPTAADNVIFELLSGNVTINSGSVCRSLDCTSGTGSYTGTLTHSSGVTLTIGDGTAGAGNVALSLASGMTYTRSNATTSAISFVSTSGTQQTVTTAGKTVGNVTFDGAGGSWLLSDALTNSSSSQVITLTAGTLNTNGMTVTCGRFSSSGSGVRTLTLGASTVTCQGSGNAWSCDTSTNMTINANTSTIICSGSGANFNGGGLTYNVVQLTGAAAATINQTNTFATLTRTGTAVKTDSLQVSLNQTVTGTLTLAGNSVTNRLLVKANNLGTAVTITNSGATMTWSNVDLQDITLGTSFDASAITGKSGDCGGNSGITFTTPETQTATGTGSFTWSTHGWTTRVPLPQDDVVISNVFSSARVITADMPRSGKSIDLSGMTWSGTATRMDVGVAASVFGSLTLKSGMTLSGSSSMTYAGRGSFTLTLSGVPLVAAMIVDSATGTLTLQDSLTSTSTLTLTSGTLDLNGQSVSVTTFSSSNSNTRTLTLGSGTLTVTSSGTPFNCGTSTGLTVTATTGTIKLSGSGAVTYTFAGGGKTYGNLWFDRGSGGGTSTITGSNTFTDLKLVSSVAHSLTFASGTTTTVTTFTVSGTSGNLVTINTSSGTTTHSLVKAGGGTISCDYLVVAHSVATPSSTWYAGTNSTNNQATATAGSGWVFTAPPGGGSTKPWYYYANAS